MRELLEKRLHISFPPSIFEILKNHSYEEHKTITSLVRDIIMNYLRDKGKI